ncbi:MAG: hypothetical protein HYR88_03290 [Verrucomicrobia bacterium]|nr:hypothetical protein [Verrucomicrobiota bacterium]MBI3867140.1 hypothetical protein [Verrucomicrobiota bacterium]
MTRTVRRLLVLLLLATISTGQSAAPGATARASREETPSAMRASLVELEVARTLYDYQTPWTRSSGNVRKSALVIGSDEILATADGLSNATVLRAQRDGRGKWYDATVLWVDYHANVALVQVADPAFWKGLKPVELMAKVSPGEEFRIERWKSGNMESRKAEFSQVVVKQSKLSTYDFAQIELTTEMTGGGWGEPLLVGNKLAGLLSSHTRNTCTVTPAPFIRFLLESRRKSRFTGIGFFDFTWQPAENPSIHRRLEFPGDPKGVLVIEGAKLNGQTNVIQKHDLILQVDGFDIDTQGNYLDPMYGRLLLENLSSRQHFAGDEVPIKVWRGAKLQEVKYKLPKVDFGTKLIPEHIFDLEPEYFILGGLVFQPLTGPFLRRWQDYWNESTPPFRLNYYKNDSPTAERKGLVVLSSVLPDPYNLGYQDQHIPLVVQKVNSRTISTLQELVEAFEHPQQGYHVIQFMKSDAIRKLVVDASSSQAATSRVLKRYGIESDRFTAEKKTAAR